MRKRLLIIALAVTVGATFGLIRTQTALAFGQCGGTVRSGAQLYQAWVRMGVVSQAAGVMRSAGFHRMDNSLSTWMRQRVVRAKLARAASPIDYGCHPGHLFSVGHRLIPKGTPMMVVLPSKFGKGDVRLMPGKGFHPIIIRVKVAGKSNCSNPENGPVFIYIYVKTPSRPRKPKSPPPAVQFSATATATATASAVCPDGTTASASGYGYGSATSTISQADADKKAHDQAFANAQADATAKVVCGSAPPPTPTYACTGLGLSASGELTATAAISVSASPGVSFKSATIDWGDSVITTDGLNQSHTYAAGGTYNVSATVTFNLPNSTTATANCTGSVTVSKSPPAHFTTVSCTGPEEISGAGSVIVKCNVTDDNGAPISLNVTSQDSNSQVSGINCYSQGGSPTCSGNGQFEFRVKGVNDTSNILTTTVKVVASANGVNSDPVFMTFDVDPSGGGF